MANEIQPHSAEYKFVKTSYTTTDTMTAIEFDSGNTLESIRGQVYGTLYIQNTGTTNSLDYEVWQQDCLVYSGSVAANAAGKAAFVQDLTHCSEQIEVKLKSTSSGNSTTGKVTICGLGR